MSIVNPVINPNGDEVYFINIVFITKEFKGIIKADGEESKEIKFIEIDKLPEEITKACVPVINDLIEKVDMYFC